MRVTFKYISLKYYPLNKIGYWIWYFKRYSSIKGFNIRIFGCHFNVRENNTTAKIIKQIHDMKK